MAQKGTALSPALQAAQDLLLSRRHKWRAYISSSALPASGKVPPFSHPRKPTSLDVDRSIPDHLGWESDPLSDHLRSTRQAFRSRKLGEDSRDLSWLDMSASKLIQPQIVTPPPPLSTTITLHPDIALAMLRQEQTTAGRIWLLLRHIDARGAGWIDVKEARALLTDKQSKLKVCGRRQLRNLLTKGESLFWQRRNDRIWLRSVAKVAAALDIRQIKGCPVAIPIDVLTRSMGPVRAHFYASFHSSRTVKTRSGKQNSMPIARKTIRGICRISRRTQRNYESAAYVRTRHNYAVGPRVTADTEKESAWKHGQALFQLTDSKGAHGTPGASYLVWQLPNSYFGPHTRQPRGQQKRINRELADLFTQGMTGNGEYLVTNEQLNHSKRFYGNGRRAAKAYNKQAKQDIYWCTAPIYRTRRSLRFWHCLPARPHVQMASI